MNYKFKTKPYAHQLTALEKSWDKTEYGYFMEMGTGKSKVLVDNMAMLYDKGKINGAIIVLWQLRNFVANSRPFFVENASTFITRM